MTVEEYRQKLHEDVALKAQSEITSAEEAFLNTAVDILSAGEEFDDFTECYYETVSRRKANIRIDGYSMVEADGCCCIFICDYHGPYGSDAVRADDINSSLSKVRHFVEESVRYDLYRDIEESEEAYEFSRMLHDDRDSISKFRFYLLTDAYNRQRSKNIKGTEVAGISVEMHVWDIARFYDVVSSEMQKESVEIDLREFGIDGIPCVKAVECHDAVADIEVLPSDNEEIIEDEYEEKRKPENLITYSSYLAVVPGSLLSDLYLEYGARLLEGNVRSFLGVRGVNKNIQTTIKNYPEMFFAYNNGIAATATELDAEMTHEGLKITRIKDLQIVNGGQTTASIANAVISAKKNGEVDLSRVFVPMKISVLEHSMSERLIPKISQYSNSQNKVDASDFFSNHPFHMRMQACARRIKAPAVDGNQYQQYWYYERTRGQYNSDKLKFKTKPSGLKAFELKYPESQVIKMVDLARYMMLYEGAPDSVSKGKQETVKEFKKRITAQWPKSDEEFNDFYYKRVVVLAIMYKRTDEIIRQTAWYKEKHSYKANVAVYTISLLFHYIRENVRGFELDFARIWNAQKLYPELERQISILSTEVYEFITRSDRPVENVTQWCKQARCWELAKKERWSFQQEFLNTLVRREASATAAKEAKEVQSVSNEVDAVKYIMDMGGAYWRQVLQWGSSRKMLSEIEVSILKTAADMEWSGRIPSVKQARIAAKARERLIREGMPMQF